MGNQLSGGTQVCLGTQLYTNRNEMTGYKSYSETRVGYNVTTIPKFQVQRIQKTYQQMLPQQQIQEKVVEKSLSVPGKMIILKSFFDKHTDVARELKKTKQGFNQSISCLEQRQEIILPARRNEVEILSSETNFADDYKDDLMFFNGLYGEVFIKKSGQVQYTDITGVNHYEGFDCEHIRKIFPMGISYGGLTKSIWFRDGTARDDAFNMMISLPPSYSAVMKTQTKFGISEDSDSELDDSDDIKTFQGINDRKVIVHSENIVLYTDLDKNKHCVDFNKHHIRKCFPFGIHSGGLPRTIWFNNEMERDQCMVSMRWNVQKQEFAGLYGSIILQTDSQIEFTSLSGDRVKYFYQPKDIRKIFPQGISYGGLQKTIWFRDVNEREKCIKAMRKM